MKKIFVAQSTYRFFLKKRFRFKTAIGSFFRLSTFRLSTFCWGELLVKRLVKRLSLCFYKVLDSVLEKQFSHKKVRVLHLKSLMKWLPKWLPKAVAFSFYGVLFAAVFASLANAQSKIKYSADSVRIFPQRDSVILNGNAVLQKNLDILKADNITIENQRELAFARRNVRFLNRRDNITFYGNNATYDMAKETITGKGFPVIRQPKENISFTASKMVGYIEKNVFNGIGDAKIEVGTGPQAITAIAKSGNYFVDQRRMEMEDGIEIFNTLDRQGNPITKCDIANFEIEVNTISCSGNASTTNTKDRSTLIAESFSFNRNSNTLSAVGNPIYLQTNDENWLKVSSKSMHKDETKNIITLKDKMLAEYFSLTTGKKTHSTRCDQATITDGNTLRCSGQVVLKRVEDGSQAIAETLIYDAKTQQGELLGKALSQKPSIKIPNSEGQYYIFAEKITIDDKNKKIGFVKDVLISTEPSDDASLADSTIQCANAQYIYGVPAKVVPAVSSPPRKPLAKRTNRRSSPSSIRSTTFPNHFRPYFECGEDVVLHRQSELLYVYADRMKHYLEDEISQLRGNVHFRKTNSPTVFLTGEVGKADVLGKKQRVNFLDYLNMRRIEKGTALRKIEKEAPKKETYTKEGNLKNSNNSADLANGSPNNERQPTQYVNALFTAQSGSYLYDEEKKIFVANDQVQITNIKDNYYVYSDTMEYDINAATLTFLGKPVLTKMGKGNEKNQIVYADAIEILEKEEIALLEKNIHLTELESSFQTPRDYFWVLQPLNGYGLTNNAVLSATKATQPSTTRPSTTRPSTTRPSTTRYAVCQNGKYQFKETVNKVDCLTETEIINKAEYQKYTSQNASYLVNDRLFASQSRTLMVEDNPKSDEIRRLEGDSFQLNNLAKEAMLVGNVKFTSHSRVNGPIDEMLCNKGTYIFFEVENRILTCEGDLLLKNIPDNVLLTGEKLRHFTKENYSIINGEPFFTWSKNEQITTVSAEVFEYFEDDSLIYAKGNVEVNDGQYIANSSFANYETEKKEVTLFGNTKLLRKDGSEFFAENVVFDVERRTIEFREKISGSLPLQLQ